jgi:hypothetical protein
MKPRHAAALALRVGNFRVKRLLLAKMPRTITIVSPAPGRAILSALQRALSLLRSNNVEVLAAAQNAGEGNGDTATILLAYLDDKPRALGLLLSAGISIVN